MASMVTGRSLSPIGKGIAGLLPVPTWILQPMRGASAITKRDQDGPSPRRLDMRCYTGQHRFYAVVDLHARSLFLHVLVDKGKTVFEKDLPAAPMRSSVRSSRSAPTWSSAASACSPAADWPCRRERRQAEGDAWQEDRQRPTEVGVQRGRVSDVAERHAGQELEATAGEEAGKRKALSAGRKDREKTRYRPAGGPRNPPDRVGLAAGSAGLTEPWSNPAARAQVLGSGRASLVARPGRRVPRSQEPHHRRRYGDNGEEAEDHADDGPDVSGEVLADAATELAGWNPEHERNGHREKDQSAVPRPAGFRLVGHACTCHASSAAIRPDRNNDLQWAGPDHFGRAPVTPVQAGNRVATNKRKRGT
jgi:hypothetical protein